MWNSYWSGRTRRELPEVNYNESSEEEDDDYNSPLVSPTRPVPTRAGSPAELAVPVLNDNVDEELEAVRRTLTNVGHTHTFRGTRPETRPQPEGADRQEPENNSSSDKGKDDSQQELEEVEVIEGHVVGTAPSCQLEQGNENQINMPDAVVNFEDENGRDGDKAIEHTRSLLIEYNPNDVKF